jgi:hypothetical protein
MTPTKIFGLLIDVPQQRSLIEKHCFGDCGKVSAGGVILDETVGGLVVCCETACPWLEREMDEPWGMTMSFGHPHEVYLRKLTDTPAPK